MPADPGSSAADLGDLRTVLDAHRRAAGRPGQRRRYQVDVDVDGSRPARGCGGMVGQYGKLLTLPSCAMTLFAIERSTRSLNFGTVVIWLLSLRLFSVPAMLACGMPWF